MRITFLIPHINISGGVKIILGYADQLVKRGHHVSVICPMKWESGLSEKFIPKCYLKASLKNFLKERPNWINCSADLKFVPFLKEKYIPDADVIVATAWQTAKFINDLSLDKGKKFYFIQGYESLYFGDERVVDSTYKYPLKKIVVSSWLQKIMEEKFNSFSELVLDPIDLDILYPTRKEFHKTRVVGLLYHPQKWKGTLEGIKCFENAKKRFPDLQLIMFGAYPNQSDVSCEFYLKPHRDKLRMILNKVDIFLSASWLEGFGLCGAEAMACGCALVTTDSGGSGDYAIHEKTALVSPQKNIEALSENLIRIIKDEGLFLRIAQNGYEHIQKFTWNNAVNKIEKVFVGC